MKAKKVERTPGVSVAAPATNLSEYVEKMLECLDRSIIATPEDLDTLEAFAKANHGSSDILLMHMAIQYGMKIAFQSLQSVMKNNI